MSCRFVVGESALNALVALHHGVPVALITGDEATADEARTFSPAIEAVVVKRSVSRFAAESLHPEVARERIREGIWRIAAVSSCATASSDTRAASPLRASVRAA